MNKAVKFSIGGTLTAVLAWLGVHFGIVPKDDVGAGILAFLAYIVAAITHGGALSKNNANSMVVLLGLCLLPAIGHAQRPATMRASRAAADAAVDSSHFKVEFGTDLRATQTGDSLPADVRLGVVVGSGFTLEGSLAAQQDSGYIEATAGLGVTAAIFPGTTSYHGQFLHAALLLHYEGADFQPGLRFGTGTRGVLSATAGALVRLSAGMEHRFARGALEAGNVAYVEVGVSFLR